MTKLAHRGVGVSGVVCATDCPPDTLGSAPDQHRSSNLVRLDLVKDGLIRTKRDVVDDVVFPHLDYSFPPALNRWVMEAHEHSREWVTRHRLVSSDRLPHFEACRFAWLAARAYPTASLDSLEIVVDWNIWLFIHDDQNDEAGFGREPAKLRALYDQLQLVLAGEPLSTDNVFALSLSELVGRMFERGTDAWRARFIASVDEYFSACIWEAENRAESRVPSVVDYIQKRPLSGALNTDIELIELCERIFLPDHVREHPLIREITLLSNNVVCWSNDIISLRKELRVRDVHNLVIALKHETNCSWQEAVDTAATMHLQQVKRFMELEQRLPKFGGGVDGEVARYGATLRAWMRGNIDWARETRRYQLDASAVPHRFAAPKARSGPISIVSPDWRMS
jgi:hypothetical protein